MSLLEVSKLQAFYGASQALFDVHLNVEEGEVVALLGRNGMGKTTTIRSICGLNHLSKGRVTFGGTDTLRLQSYRIARLGIGLVPEGRRCFSNLTVAENLTVAARRGPWDQKSVERLFPRLGERRSQMARTLSGGEQQMLAIGRALMTNPRLLILDEATEGLAPVIRLDIWRSISLLKQGGQSILVVDKSLRELLPVANRCVVLDKGRTTWIGPSDELNADLQSRYIGI
ncbi:ABC transporter ATP-binding protein [Ensifer sp. ENS05]|uniref:ABC transporter ATP-binding protein n=1 Tax=Ensifer sp. ENS05 TaxID=2769277 RepID=UPI001780EDC9|nr:ABC transporter ATP-binding protein [Ensifer sp. ENS05]MBD9596874.1 ABC transporter ATP-binding protein [Ensifer sp. ENS05]